MRVRTPIPEGGCHQCWTFSPSPEWSTSVAVSRVADARTPKSASPGHVQPRRDIRTEMDAQRAAVALDEHLEIAARLRRLDDAERVALAGHRQVRGVVAGDLQEDAGVGAALVGLAGRVQEARAEAEAGRDARRASRTRWRIACSARSCAVVMSTYASSAK